jgi:hypothetical protein
VKGPLTRTKEEWEDARRRAVKLIRSRRGSQQEIHHWLTTENTIKGLPLTEAEYLDCLYAATSIDESLAGKQK